MLESSVSELDLNVKFCAVLTRSLSHGSGRFGAVNFPSVSEQGCLMRVFVARSGR